MTPNLRASSPQQLLRMGMNTVVRIVTTPHLLLGWVMAAVLAYLVLVPLVEIISQSLRVQRLDIARLGGATVGDWTGFYWIRAVASDLSTRLFYRPIMNTLGVSLSFTVLSMVMGVGLAWLMVRTDLPWKAPIAGLALLPYILPSWTLALAWITFFRHDQQVQNVQGVLQQLTGIVAPDWLVYGPVPITIVLAFNFFAFSYLLAAAALTSVDSTLEESAELHGASRLKILSRVTLPLILPSLASAFVLTFAAGLGTFGVPAYLGRPANFEMMSTFLYGNMKLGRQGDAFVLATIMVVMASLTVYLNAVALGKRKQFVTMGGKGGKSRTTSLGKLRYPLATCLLLVMLAISVFPILLLTLQSLQHKIGEYSLSNLTLDFWIGAESGVLGSARVMAATFNTVLLGFSVASICTLMGLLLGYIIARGRGTVLSTVIEQLSFFPYLIPAVAFGAVYLTMWATPTGPIPPLYGSMALLILASCVLRLPYSARTGSAAMMQVGKELEEAARVHGASFFTIMSKILMPLIRNGLFAGFVLVFIGVTKDLSLAAMLASARTEVLSVVALSYTELGIDQVANAIALIITAIVLVGVWASKKITKSDPMRAL
jgi:iron(III) transport system permease protein